jgi:hypothetical protein
VILAEAVLAQGLPAGTLEVEAGGIHEHQVETREPGVLSWIGGKAMSALFDSKDQKFDPAGLVRPIKKFAGYE